MAQALQKFGIEDFRLTRRVFWPKATHEDVVSFLLGTHTEKFSTHPSSLASSGMKKEHEEEEEVEEETDEAEDAPHFVILFPWSFCAFMFPRVGRPKKCWASWLAWTGRQICR